MPTVLVKLVAESDRMFTYQPVAKPRHGFSVHTIFSEQIPNFSRHGQE